MRSIRRRGGVSPPALSHSAAAVTYPYPVIGGGNPPPSGPTVIAGSAFTFSRTASVSLTTPVYTVPAGANKRLLVFIHWFLNTSDLIASAASVFHAGQPMTEITAANSQSNNANGGATSNSRLAVYELILGSNTPSGAISANWTNSNRAVLVAVTIQGCHQSNAAAAAVAQSIGPVAVSSVDTDLVIAAAVNDAQNVIGDYTLAELAGQSSVRNERINSGTGAEANLAVSTKAAGAPTTSMGWTGAASLGPRQQIAVLAFNAA